jgi:FtsH-binding integral membrane protein
VVFLYEPDIYVVSIIVSMISTAIFVALIIIDTRKKKKAAATVVAEATETEEKTEGEN